MEWMNPSQDICRKLILSSIHHMGFLCDSSFTVYTRKQWALHTLSKTFHREMHMNPRLSAVRIFFVWCLWQRFVLSCYIASNANRRCLTIAQSSLFLFFMKENIYQCLFWIFSKKWKSDKEIKNLSENQILKHKVGGGILYFFTVNKSNKSNKW